jgi:hypothetical protein
MTRTPHPVDPRQPRRRNRQPDYRHGYIAGRAAGRAARQAAADRKGCCLLRALFLLPLLPALILAGALATWRTR